MRIPTAPASRPVARALAVLAIILLSGLTSSALAQIFDADRYLRSCLELERGGDYETARQSCLNALAARPGTQEARLALGRIELALGNLGEAESQLRQAGSSAEALLLLADVLIRGRRIDEAGAVLSRAAAAAGPEHMAELAYLRGRMAQESGRFNDALRHYREAVRLEPDVRRNRYRLAALLLELGEAREAQDQLTEYLRTGTADADIRSLLGRTMWAQGELVDAARELETSLAQRSARDAASQARDLRDLGLVYYGLGDYQAGGLALREATRRGNLLAGFSSGSLIWLVLLLVLLAVHLVGESRIGVTTSADTGDGPRLWTTGHVYGILFTALAASMPLAILYGALRYENLLALFTPVQRNDTLAIFFLTFALMVAWGSWRRARINGWSPAQTLLSGSERAPAGVLLGLAAAAAVLAYRHYVPEGPWRSEFFLDLAHLTPAVAAAMAIVPFSEIFFRGFAFPALENRYGGALATLLSGLLTALVFAGPVLVLLALGLVLASAYRSTRSGAMTFAAQASLHWGLLVGAALLPWVRSLFV